MLGSRGVIILLTSLEVAVACGGRANDARITNGSAGLGGSSATASDHAVAGRTSDRGGAGATSSTSAGASPDGDLGSAGNASSAGQAAGGAPDAGAGGAPDAGAGGATSGLIGDINDDGCVDLKDYAILARCNGYPTTRCANAAADLQHDGWVDVVDYLLLAQHWYQGPRCRAFCQPVDDGAAGAAGAESRGSPDLNADGCVNFDDLDLLAQSYGCDSKCAAPGSDLVPDDCVDDRDRAFLMQSFDTQGACVQVPAP